jgi:hypothetical protein
VPDRRAYRPPLAGQREHQHGPHPRRARRFVQGSLLDQALQDVFGVANVDYNVDGFGVAQDIRANR